MPFYGCDSAKNGLEQCGFARAGWADDADEITAMQCDMRIVNSHR
jgi:hypothetical protein